MRIFLVFIITIVSINSFYSQSRNRGNTDVSFGGKISGKVIDANDGLPLEYTNIVLFTVQDTAQVTGTIADVDGKFILEKIRPNTYSIKISFIGYEPVFIDDVNVRRGESIIDLGTIKLIPAEYQTESAIVIANKSPVEYHIDKKVINVSGQSTSISGTAVEVLENVPSVNVDIEGNVTLRGSGSFTLLIDGRPSILDPNDALQQIPASTIENIEIVTNPSAKFDPEGVAGIINIIMKRNQYVGISALINSNVGLNDKYGIDILTSYKTNGYSFYLGADYRDSKFLGDSREERITYGNDFNTFLNSTSDGNRGRDGYNINGGADFSFDKNNQLGISFRYGDGAFSSNSDVSFHEFTDPSTEDLRYENVSLRERGGDRFSSGLNYKHIFGPNKHEIITDLNYSSRNG
ncbi:MAG: carboxypeptidase regulatory-like domain-containing protein, partial [Melioribacteraceae bacterium]|nr:carboxypeptidase regulatory-like domain-containing protein [Melioribacteraceae bacterium]